MSTQSSVNEYFEKILSSLRDTEQGSQVLSSLKNISEEISRLEKNLKNSYQTQDDHFRNYARQINLFSSLIEFQRKIIHFKSPDDAAQAAFAYIKENIDFDHAFIHLKLSGNGEEEKLIASDENNLERYQKFFDEKNGLKKIKNYLQEKDLGVLISDVGDFYADEIDWDALGAKSAIIFPLRVQGHFLGVGVLTANGEPFTIHQLSFINLILGLFSLLLFQHFYFFHLKEKLFKQSKLQKVLEEVKYADYFDKGPINVYSVDGSGVILHANASALKNRPFHKENIVGEKFLNFLPQEHRKPFEDILNNLETGELKFYKCPVMDESRLQVREFYITKMELHDRFNLNIIFSVDITQLYFKEQTQVRDEILDQITQFSRVITGYLNNLLTLMIPNVSLVKSHLPEDHSLQKHLNTMEKSLNQAAGLVQKFLNYSLDEIEQPKRTDLNELIKTIMNRFKEKFPRNNVDFNFFLDPDIPPMPLYPRRLTQLVRILIQNSLEALKNKGLIRITTKIVKMERDGLLQPHSFFLPKGKYIELAVEDNGVGIEPKTMPHIFKPFFSTKIKNESLGLGLFVVYNMVKDLDGRIYVKSTPNQSTTFFVYLPMRGEPQILAPKPVKKEPSKQKDRPSILVVEDEYNIRNVLKEVFEMNGYSVYTAVNGKEGVELFQKHYETIDLIILDMVMPVMDGKTAYKEIKKIKLNQKIIVISGYTKQEDLKEMLSNGSVTYMNKPFQITDIVKKVKSVLAN